MTTPPTSEAYNPDPTSLPCLEEVSGLDIPLTSPVDVPTFFNKRFPAEQHLHDALPSFISSLETAQSAVDAQLSQLMRDHRHDSDRTTRAVSEVDSTLATLHESLTVLATSAASAQAEIDAALTPAKPIHTALLNVTHALDALDALVQLDAAVLALESAASTAALDRLASDSSPFADARNALAALDAQPEMAATLRPLPALRARSTVAHESLRSAILAAFKRLSDIVSLSSDHPPERVDDAVVRLRTACTVADAMRSDVRAEVVGAFVKRRRETFRAAFVMDESGLSGADKRFSWLRRELRANWARLGGERVDRGWGRVFPEEWNVARRVADGIVAEIRDWTSSTLDAGADRDVAVLVSALSKTKEFEVELDRRFATSADTSFVGTVSESFGPWMGAFVTQEDDHLGTVLTELLREESWIVEDGSVLKSATELFLVIKKSMRTCASLDVRQPLFSLHRVFKKHLSRYSASLITRLPGIKSNPLADSSKPTDFEKTRTVACAIVNTSLYCSTTVEQLEDNLREIVESAFSTDIDFSNEKERFLAVSAKGIQSIIALLDEDLEPELRKISEQDWASWSEVGDTSKFVESISSKTASSMKELSTSLSRIHFRFLLEKFAASFISRFRAHVYKCAQMNNFGAQQLLLDTSAIKAMLLGIPASVHAPTPATFLKHVNREIVKVEAMLKVILAPVASSVDTYVALVPDGTAEDFQKVLEIRGLKRADAAPLVLSYTRRIGPSQRLKPTQRGEGSSRIRSMSPSGSSYNNSNASGTGSDPNNLDQGQSAAVDSVRNLFGRLGSSLIDTGISDRIGQVSSQFESTTDRLKREAAARWSMFGK